MIENRDWFFWDMETRGLEFMDEIRLGIDLEIWNMTGMLLLPLELSSQVGLEFYLSWSY